MASPRGVGGHPPDAEPGALAVSVFLGWWDAEPGALVSFGGWDCAMGVGLVGTTRGTRTWAMAKMPDALLRG